MPTDAFPEERLARFGAMILLGYRALDQAEPFPLVVQQAGIESGVLTEITATVPCGPGCACAGRGFPRPCLESPDDVDAAARDLCMPADVRRAIVVLKRAPADLRHELLADLGLTAPPAGSA